MARSRRVKSIICFWWRRIDDISLSNDSPSADVQKMKELAIDLDLIDDGSWLDRSRFLSSARFIILYVPETDLMKFSAIV